MGGLVPPDGGLELLDIGGKAGGIGRLVFDPLPRLVRERGSSRPR